MSDITVLPISIVNYLNTCQALDDIQFLTEFPPQAKAVPLRKSIVSIGIEELQITDHFTENDDGVLIRDEYCRTAQIRICAGIHVPFSLGGNKCHEVFTKVVDYLTFETDLNVIKSECQKIHSDRDTGALVMNAFIDFTADFCPADSTDENFECFLPKDLLCGTHIRNQTIHITSEERELWNGRFVSGSYTGTGISSRTVSLGFKPTFVVVYPNGDLPQKIDFTKQTVETYYGCAQNGQSSNGIELTSTGFKLLQGASYAIGNTTPMLNKAGSSFSYLAVK